MRLLFFFFQAEDGIRDYKVTGVQTCALPISHEARDLWSRLAGPGHAGLKLAAALAAAAVLFLSFATGTYRVAADARIEGEIQRAVTAPFQAYVRESAVRPGDTVRRGQMLATLDDRDLRVERARLAAQHEQFAQQYRDAMARQERAQVRIASAQMAQARSEEHTSELQSPCNLVC